MAARRLVIVLIVLLVVSTIAAWLIPRDGRFNDTTGSTTTLESVPEVTDTVPDGELLMATINADTRPIKVVRVSLGDQLELSVRASTGDTITIPGLGLSEPVAPGTPAVFDLFADNIGRFTVRAVAGSGAGRVVGRVEVRPPKKKPKSSPKPGPEAPLKSGSTAKSEQA